MSDEDSKLQSIQERLSKLGLGVKDDKKTPVKDEAVGEAKQPEKGKPLTKVRTKRAVKGKEEKLELDLEGKNDRYAAEYKGNPMKMIRISKLVVNICMGEGGEKLVKAEKVIKMITGRDPVRTIARTTNKDLGVRKGMPIGCKVTLRGKEAEKLLRIGFWIRENRIASYSFDNEGNFSFGIPDYTNFPGMKYDPEIGIIGMDLCVNLNRAGKRISERKRAASSIPQRHRITREEAIDFVKKKFNVEVIG
ncbi:MAG: 50S ribosomal protein L5 [Thermoplasmata archaeon]